MDTKDTIVTFILMIIMQNSRKKNLPLCHVLMVDD